MDIPVDPGEIRLFHGGGAGLGSEPRSRAGSHPAASPSAPHYKHVGTKRVSLVLILQDVAIGLMSFEELAASLPPRSHPKTWVLLPP